MKKKLVVIITLLALNIGLYTIASSQKPAYCGKALRGCIGDCGSGGDLFTVGCKVGCAIGYAMC